MQPKKAVADPFVPAKRYSLAPGQRFQGATEPPGKGEGGQDRRDDASEQKMRKIPHVVLDTETGF
jgi:hypothetical protein